LFCNVIGNTVDCGNGSITIVWTATDGGGRTASCIQQYFVANNDAFDIADTEHRLYVPLNVVGPNGEFHTLSDDVEWPADIELTTCGLGLEPADLALNGSPNPYTIPFTGQPGQPVSLDAYPTIFEGACDNVAVGHSDQVLNFGVDDACLKVLRKWYVIDWCQADANQDPTQPGPGVWHYTQVIKVTNSEDPNVTVVNFPSVIDNYEEDCGETFAEFTITVDDDCTPQNDIQVSWEFFSIALDANGNPIVPEVATSISTGTGLAASDALVNGYYKLIYTVSDGCDNTVWETHYFTVKDSKKPTPVCIFGIATTDDIPANGLYPITLYVTDEAGNFDFCSTFIDVQDPNIACPDPTGLITGIIENEFQEVIEEVTVTLSDDNGMMNVPVVTGPTGIFQFNQTYGDYDVTPEKDINYLNGVTTYDLVLIAADANNSQSISALDLVKIRALILHLEDEFSNNTSWRFVDQDYVFPNPANPWQEEFPEYIGLTSTIIPANFIAAKVGDVNGSASPNSLLGSDTRTFSGNLALQLEATKVAEGETFTIDFKAKDFKQIAGYQFTSNYY